MNSLEIFLSHKSEYAEQTAQLKNELSQYGISCFVAHEDVEPTKEWQISIEKSLFSMDILVALMTDNFQKSNWTDQEIGIALGQDKKVISINLGTAPYGFIGKTQALTVKSWDGLAKKIVDTMLNNYLDNPKVVDVYIGLMEKCPSFDKGNELANYLPNIKFLSNNQIDKMIEIYNSNEHGYNQVSGSMGFNGSKPEEYGKGLVYHLNRIRENEEYKTNDEHKIIKIDS